MEGKYSDPATQELLDIASFLGPRFRMDYVTQENVANIKARLKLEMEQEAQTVT